MHNHKNLAESHPHLKEFLPFLDDFNKESERGVVLISVSYLDNQLREIISAFLCLAKAGARLLDGSQAPLGTFAARADAAAALGLITEQEYQELNVLRKIRNKFAHDHRVKFSNQSIIDRCRNLSFAAQDYGEVVLGAREQFSTSAVCLILNFTNRPHYVLLRRPKLETWPY